MIWILLIIIALAVALFLVTPFLKGGKNSLTVSLFMLGFIGASLSLYALLGTPVQPQTRPSTPVTQSPAEVTQSDILAMVDGLAARLSEAPDNEEGWIRLIRSRIVLGDVQALIRDHKAMTAQYKNAPDTIDKINEASGFNEFTRSIDLTPNAPINDAP